MSSRPMFQETFQGLVREELVNARIKFPHPESIPDGWTRHQLMLYWVAVIEEEFIEFRDAVFVEQCGVEALSELIQISAMCQRTAESCGLVRRCE